MAEIKVMVMRVRKKRMVVAVAVGPFFNRGCHVDDLVPDKCLAGSPEMRNI